MIVKPVYKKVDNRIKIVSYEATEWLDGYKEHEAQVYFQKGEYKKIPLKQLKEDMLSEDFFIVRTTKGGEVIELTEKGFKEFEKLIQNDDCYLYDSWGDISISSIV